MTQDGPMPTLTVRLKKGRDGPHTLACTRADGSVTVQHNRHDVFPPHDLTHFAVESVLGFRRGFYGLVAEGWDLADFGTPWPRGPLPPDLDPAEQIVGRLDLERATGERVDAHSLNEHVSQWHESSGVDAPRPRHVTESDLAAIRQLRNRLIARWRELAPGDSMELEFPAG